MCMRARQADTTRRCRPRMGATAAHCENADPSASCCQWSIALAVCACRMARWLAAACQPVKAALSVLWRAHCSAVLSLAASPALILSDMRDCGSNFYSNKPLTLIVLLRSICMQH